MMSNDDIQLLREIKYSKLSVNLSQEQRNFIDLALDGHNLLVDACIGSGKTTSIQALCDVFDSDKSILYLTFNKLLKIEAKEKIKNKNCTVTNYHGFVYPYLMRNKVKSSIERSIQTFLDLRLKIKHFDVLIVDEYQDINDSTSALLEYIKSTNPNMQLIVVGDMKQKLYDSTVLDVNMWIKGFLGNHQKIEFTRCFRLNDFHARKIGEAWKKSIIGVNQSQKIRFMSLSEALLKLSGLEPHETLVLGKNNGMRTRALNELQENYPEKFNKFTVYNTTREKDANLEPSKDTYIFTTFDSSKGLERKYCFIFDYNEHHLNMRRGMPDTDQDVINNLFLVAASRGKDEIIFVYDDVRNLDKIENKYPITDAVGLISIEEFGYKVKTQISNKYIPVTELFEFKYVEHVEACRDLLNVEKIDLHDKSVINIDLNDAQLDISSAIGNYVSAAYFEDVDVKDAIEFHAYLTNMTSEKLENLKRSLLYQLSAKNGGYYEMIKLRPFDFNMPYRVGQYSTTFKHDETDIQWELLVLLSATTGDYRYIREITSPYITDKQSQAIIDRVSTFLSSNDIHEKSLKVREDDDIQSPLKIGGRLDVIHDDVVYELKFVNEISSIHLLQCAMYLIMTGHEIGRVWNIRDNTMFEISIKDREEFLNRVAICATKGRKSGWNKE